jgi:hypothetical protein
MRCLGLVVGYTFGVLRIRFVKLTDERHVLEIVRRDGGRERMECETRSYFLHDLLHLAVESEGGLTQGFWGRLAAGTTLAAMNDRTKPAGPESGELLAIEQLVGALHAATKGRSPNEVVSGMRQFAEAIGQPLPHWLTDRFVAGVQERMRRFVGHWKATPYGAAMELEWPEPPAAI